MFCFARIVLSHAKNVTQYIDVGKHQNIILSLTMDITITIREDIDGRIHVWWPQEYVKKQCTGTAKQYFVQPSTHPLLKILHLATTSHAHDHGHGLVHVHVQ